MRRGLWVAVLVALLLALGAGSALAVPPSPSDFHVDVTSVSWAAVDVYWTNVQGATGYRVYFNNSQVASADIPEYMTSAVSGTVNHKWRVEDLSFAGALASLYMVAYDGSGESVAVASVPFQFDPVPVYVTNWNELETWLQKWFVPSGSGVGFNKMQTVTGDLGQWGPFGTVNSVVTTVQNGWQEPPSDVLANMPQVEILPGQVVPMMDFTPWLEMVAKFRELIRAAMWLEFIYLVVRMLVPVLKV